MGKGAHSRRRRNRNRAEQTDRPAAGESAQSEVTNSWQPSRVLQRPFVATFIGAALYWASFPPLGLSLLGWLAPLPWVALIAAEKLPGKRPYLAIWVAASCGWLAILQGVRLPFWALYFGWFILSVYVAVYIPLFIAMTRWAYHRLGVPLLIAAPLTWAGLEYIRGHYPVSFAVALLGHTQVRIPHMIQVADIGGAVTLSFLMMSVAVALTGVICTNGRRRSWLPIAVASGVVALTLGYGQWRLQTAPQGEPIGKVALLQGTFNTVFESDSKRNWAIFEQYFTLARDASQQNADLDAIIWPESTFSGNNPEMHILSFPKVPADAPIDQATYEANLNARVQEFQSRVQSVARLVNSPSAPDDPHRNITMIAGTETWYLSETDQHVHNSALLIQPDGTITDRYFKMHRVLIGEYIPLADKIDGIRKISPVQGIKPGDEPKGFRVGSMTLMPNICFESTVPQLVRGQLATLDHDGEPVDAIVNMSHDGWFWGSSILDLHMACGVFRAVENRVPFLAAANPGLTFSCDGSGRIGQMLAREKRGVVVVEVRRDGRWSLYQVWGDAPWLFAAILCFFFVCMGRFGRGKAAE